MVDAFNMTVCRPMPLVVAGSYQASSPGNILTDQPGERTTFDNGGGYVTLDAGYPITVNQVGLLYTDLGHQNTWRLVGSSTANYAEGTFATVASGTVETTEFGQSLGRADPGYRHMFAQFAPATYRYWQISVGTAGNQASSAGRIVLGLALQVEYNADYGDTSWGYEEAPEPDTLDSGVTVLEELPAAPYFEFGLTWVSESEMESWWNLEFGRLQWKRVPVMVVRRPDPNSFRHTGIFYGILRLQPFVAAEFDMFEVRGKIRSMV